MSRRSSLPWGDALARIGVVATLVLVCLLASPDAGAQPEAADSTLLARFEQLQPDDPGRLELVQEDKDGFRAEVETRLAGLDFREDAPRRLAEAAGRAYLEVTADSVLLADVTFLAAAEPSTREAWVRAVELDREATALRSEDPEGSAERFAEAIAIYARIGHLRREAVAWGSLGTSSWNVDRPRAEMAYRTALARRRELGDPLWLGRALNTLGGIQLQAGAYDSALVYYEEARVVREPLGRPGDLASTLVGLGAAHQHLGDFTAAETYYLRSIELAGPGTSSALRAQEGLANLAYDRGDYARAAALYGDVLSETEAAGNPGMTSSLLSKRGESRARLGEFAGALDDLDRARSLQEELGDVRGLTETLNRTGIVLHQLGETGGAYRSWLAARDVALEADHPAELARIYMNLGLGATELGQSGDAASNLQRSIALCDSLGDPLCSRDARSKLATSLEEIDHDYAGALAIHEELLALDRAWGNRDAEALDLGNMGVNKLRMGRQVGAVPDLRAAIALSQETGNREFLWRWYLNLADSFEETGRLDSAAVYNALAIESLEESGGTTLGEEMKAAFQGERSIVYEAQVQVLAKMDAASPGGGHAEAALAVAERGRARAFLDMLGEAQVDIYAGAPEALLASQDSLGKEVDGIRRRLRQAEAAASPESLRALRAELSAGEAAERRAEERLRFESPRLRELAPGRVATLAEMRSALLGSPSSVILEYSLGDSSSWLWCVTADRVELYPLPRRDVLERAVRALRESVARRPQDGRGQMVASGGASSDWRTNASRLWELLLAPAGSAVERAEVVTLLPDGALHYVPFEALTRPGSGAPDYALAGKEVHLGPSATILARLTERRGPAGPLTCLAIGDPRFAPPEGAGLETDSGADPAVDSLLTVPLAGTRAARAGLLPLPHSREEVQAIASAFGTEAGRVLLGADARETRVREPGFASSYRILHFATHGLVHELVPSRSALALAYPQDPGEDGYLQVSEITGMELEADLVVLSACETGKGKMVRGEGVLGLPRAFLYAGARNVVVSLWSVSDEATAVLMSRFYEEMVGRGTEPALALARAKRAMIDSPTWNHPFYWAGFVFLGPG